MTSPISDILSNLALEAMQASDSAQINISKSEQAITALLEAAIGEDEPEHKRYSMPDRAYEDGYTDGRNELRHEIRAKLGIQGMTWSPWG